MSKSLMLGGVTNQADGVFDMGGSSVRWERLNAVRWADEGNNLSKAIP